MRVNEHEKALIGYILAHPDPIKVGARVCAELDYDKFGTGSHRLIYKAIQDLVIKGREPNALNVGRVLGNEFDSVGGSAYLSSLIRFNKALNLRGDYEDWVRVVDAAGRLRHIGMVVDKYHKLYDDFDQLLDEVSSPEDFVSNIMQEINEGVQGLRIAYRPIGDAVGDLRKRAEAIKTGNVVDLIPTGWPSLESYFIPRPCSLGVLAGLSSIGKTQLALQIALGVAIHIYEHNSGGYVTLNTLESPGWRMAIRMACSLAGIDSDDIDSGRLFDDRELEEKYNDTLDYIEGLPILYDDNPDIGSKSLLWSAISQHNIQGPRRLGVTDYLQMLRGSEETEELRVSSGIKHVHLIARETGSCEIAITAFNNSVLMSRDKMGSLSNARYSGIVVYEADWGGIMYNPPQMRRKNINFTLPDGFSEDSAYFIIEKNRDHKIGRVEFGWKPEWTRFSDRQLPIGTLYQRQGFSSDF